MAQVKQYFAPELPEGKGARVKRLLGNGNQDMSFTDQDPFLMLDYFNAQLPAGFPDHPHRGFETVTYMTEGTFYHEDFTGHAGRIDTGDIQWMSAGRGIVHAEMPGSTDGNNRGFQLWVNLPASKKMMEPMYQEIKSHEIKEFNDPDGKLKVRVIAGESCGVVGGVKPNSESMYLDAHIAAGKSFVQKVPVGWKALVFVYNGDKLEQKSSAMKTECRFEQVTIFMVQSGEMNEIQFTNNGTEQAKFILIAGKPLNEPIAKHGPFVMNTQEQLQQTFIDYQNAQNGFENARTWSSKIRQMAQNVNWRPDGPQELQFELQKGQLNLNLL